jgi:uncharacterized protein involved in exopolysaccharide biosynthesis
VLAESRGGQTSVEPTNAAAAEAVHAQIRALDAEIVRLKEEKQRIAEQLAVYQARVEAVPIREQEMTDLVRDYGTGKEYYSQLLSKKLAADTAMQMETLQKGEQFTILDPAQVPEQPSSPNRLIRYVAGLLIGVILGLLGALGTELFGGTITSADQITAVTGVVVMGSIPNLSTRLDRNRRRMAIVGVAAGVAVLVLAALLFLYHLRGRIL